jgi:sortase A
VPTQTTTLEAPPQRRRTALLVAGLALVLTGTLLLGYVAWQYWGTNIVSKQKHEEITTNLLESWDAGGGVAPDRAELGDALALVRVPRFGTDYVVPVVEGVRDDDLSRGLGHYPGTALPGEIGNFAVAGHRVTHGEPFRDLPGLRAGDQVVVETAEAVHTYQMDTDGDGLTVRPEDTWVLRPVPDTEPDRRPTEALITLTTCAELFHTSDRLVAFGHLVRTEPK